MVVKWGKKMSEDVRFYVRKKKFKKILDDIASVLPDLEAGNLIGDKLAGFNLPKGSALYKVRIAKTSANVGKSNGFRLIYYLAIEEKIYLLTIYSKKDDERIPNDAQIAMLVGNVLEF
ncbi:MAG: hypothetical protein SR3Q1_00405 [Quinella sp. 3Q1]|nr:hypothetical protein [Quinella sp. 3Q1]MBR6888548.1 hypothetical protein [Selenomonadaceae bacterium]